MWSKKMPCVRVKPLDRVTEEGQDYDTIIQKLRYDLIYTID